MTDKNTRFVKLAINSETGRARLLDAYQHVKRIEQRGPFRGCRCIENKPLTKRQRRALATLVGGKTLASLLS